MNPVDTYYSFINMLTWAVTSSFAILIENKLFSVDKSKAEWARISEHIANILIDEYSEVDSPPDLMSLCDKLTEELMYQLKSDVDKFQAQFGSEKMQELAYHQYLLSLKGMFKFYSESMENDTLKNSIFYENYEANKEEFSELLASVEIEILKSQSNLLESMYQKQKEVVIEEMKNLPKNIVHWCEKEMRNYGLEVKL